MDIPLKLLDKLKKLKLNKYRYKITCSYKTFIEKQYKGYNISLNDETITFYINKLPKDINNDSIIIHDRFKNYFSKIIKTKWLFIVSMFIIIFLFVTSNLFVREIRFSNENTYSYVVYHDVKKYLKNIGPLYYINENLNDISNDLRKKYFSYEYIGIRKKGSIIYIDIEPFFEYPNINKDNDKPCDLVSAVDGKIVGIELKNGVTLVNINQIVNKGDLLVSGNLNYHTNPNDLTSLVHASGSVIIEYAEYKKIIIPKNVKYKMFEEEENPFLELVINNKVIGKNRLNLNEEVLVKNNVFNMIDVLKINFVRKYKSYEYEYNISFNDAKIIAEEQIFSKFLFEKINEKECIKFIKYIKSDEQEENFSFYYLVKYNKNAVINKYY